jgi:hypothetical protein
VVIAALVIGIFPKPFFNYMDKTSGDVAAQAQRYIPAQAAQAAPADTGGQGGK